MVSIRFCIVFIALFFHAGFSEAKLYKWVDENGVTHFSNTAPPQGEVDVQSRGEVKGSGPVNNRSTGIDHVINSYKQDELRDRNHEIKERFRDRIKSSNQSQIELYKKWVERDKITLKQCQDDLRRVERVLSPVKNEPTFRRKLNPLHRHF